MPQPRQPFVHDLITVLAAPTQVLSQRSGEIATSVDRPTAQGVIHADTRVLSGLSVTIDGEPGEHLSTALDGNRAQFTVLLPTIGTGIVASGDQSLRLDRFRVVEPGRLAETLVISSPLPAAIEVDVMVVLSSDFAPLKSIRLGQPGPPLPFPVPIGDHFGWVQEEVALSLVAHGANLLLSEDRCRLTL
ncbi:MAG TPA: glycogen debranching N-terminal domain-containing protein, partial [Propionibacteriaceae bacterium]|nr:glycogen debranching N-terminal domain-containing protein [Propionibacteriaceae bacterium]